MRGMIFDTEQHAKNWDWGNNTLSGSISRYLYARKPLEQTTTLTKAEYAELMGVPDTIEGEVNPAYEALEDRYTLRKYALIVGNALDTEDDEGNVIPHPDVVDVSEMLYTPDNEV